MEDSLFSISYICHQHAEALFRYLFSIENIRRNIDYFFLFDASCSYIARKIQQSSAIAYRVKNGRETVGCFLAFRKGNELFGHFFFRLFPGLSVTKMVLQILPRMVRHFDRQGIYVSQITAEIPEWNHAAIKVCKQCGAINQGIKLEKTFGNILQKIVSMTYFIPDEMHCRRKKMVASQKGDR